MAAISNLYLMKAGVFLLPHYDVVRVECCSADYGNLCSEVESVRAESVSQKCRGHKHHGHHVDGEDVAKTIDITAERDKEVVRTSHYGFKMNTKPLY